MTSEYRPVSNYARYIGRVGALAAALGIGVLGAASPGLASAETSGAGTESSSSADSSTTKPESSSDSSTGDGTSSTKPSLNDDDESTESSSVGDTSSTDGAPGASETDDAAETDADPSDEADDSLEPAPAEPSAPVSPDPEPGAPTEPSDPAPTVSTPLLTASSDSESKNSSDRPTAVVSQPAASTSPTIEVDYAANPVSTEQPVAVVESDPVPVLRQASNPGASGARAAAVTGPEAQVSTPPVGFVGLLNSFVTNLLNPFLEPAPNAADPFTPIAWALLGWVRRTLFNQAPAVTIPTSISQTGQVVTGNIGVTDAEGDPLRYTVKQQPKNGTVTIDQATGIFTYTPNDINYTSVQEDSFTVSVADNGFNLLGLFTPRNVKTQVGVDVLSPEFERVILNMPDSVTKPVNPRYSQDGNSIFFSGTPTAGGRAEIYEIDVDDVDGSTVRCVTCGATVAETGGLFKPVPFTDGSGRVMVLLNGLGGSGGPRYSVFEPVGYLGNTEARVVPVLTPAGGGASLPGLPPGGILDRQREMRPSPDGSHVLFTRIVFGQTGGLQALPIVGELVRTGDQYDVTNAVVVWPTGEGKQWTPDGKGVIILGGAIDAGNVDDIMVDVSGRTGDNLIPGSPFRAHRITGNLDYDEDLDLSPNMVWMAVGSTRGFEALTPMTRIIRQNFLPVYVGAAVYAQYADNQVRNVSNQNWLIAIEDDLKRENGIPLFVQDDPSTPDIDEGDGWASRSMPSWNADGTAITFWESGNGDEHGHAATDSRIVIAKLKYTTSVGTVGDTTTEFDPSAFQALDTYVAKTTPLPSTGSYAGARGGTAVVNEVTDAATRQTTRTVTYTNYVNEDGLILNGTEKATYGPTQSSVAFLAQIDVTDATGANRGNLDADAVINAFSQSVTGHITSTLDGDTQTIPDPTKAEDAKTGA